MKKALKSGFISSFIMKISALLFMTFDHIGLLLRVVGPYQRSIIDLSNAFRTIGRMALPLFAFMIVEGVIHTKSFKKYLSRLLIMALFISAILAVITYVNFGFDTSSISGAGNIFLDLSLLAITIYLLKQDNKLLWLITLLPLGLSIISFSVKSYEFATRETVLWYPTWLYLQYDWFTIVLGVGYYLANKAFNAYVIYSKERNGIDESIWEIDNNKEFAIKLLQIFALVAVSIFYYLFVYFWPEGVFWDAKTQLYAILSGAFILFYNGKRGYNAKWFQYGSYLYYPLHLLVIILIFIIVNGGF